MPFIPKELYENDTTAIEKELELKDKEKGRITFDLNSQLLDERLRPYREAKLYTMRYAMGKIWEENWYMHRVFSARAKEFPHVPAYLGFYEAEKPNEELTYRQLDNITSLMSLEIAKIMPTELSKMPTLVIYLNRGAHLISSVIGAMKCHMAMVVVEDNAPITRLFFVMEDTQAFILLTTKELHDNMLKSLKEREVTNPGEDKIPSNLKVLYVDTKYKELEKICKSSPKDYVVPTDIAQTDSPFGIPPLLEHTVMCIIYTSGSTGKPKGVMLEYGGFSNYAAIEQVVTAMRPGDRNLQTQSLAFVAGFHEVWRCLLCGGTLHFSTSKAIPMLGPDLSPWMIKNKINVFKAVPSLLRTLIVKSTVPLKEGEVVMPDLRICHIGGEPITPELVEYFAAPHRNFLNTYGSTETSSNCSIGQCFPGQTVTIGSALPTFSSHILKDGIAADVGILFIGGKSLARGYLNLPEANKKFQIIEGLGRVFDTGDLTEYIEGTKNVKFCGRADRQIKINGYRLELDEVEIAVRRLAIVKEAVVVFKDTVLIAFVQPMDVNDLDGFKVDAIKPILLKGGLPYYGVPSQFRLIKEFPKTVTGKLDNTQLFTVPLLKTGKDDGNVGTLTEVESIIAKMYEDMLVLPPNSIGRSGNFFELGGDSGKAGLCISKLRQNEDARFTTVAVSDLYASPSVGGLADTIERKIREKKEMGGADEDLVKLPFPTGTPYPYFCSFIQLLVGFCIIFLDSLHVFVAYQYLYPFVINSLIKPLDPNFLLKGDNVIQFMILLIFVMSLVVIAYLYYIFAFVLMFLAKWLLIGCYKEGRYVIYGSYFLRHWIVERLSRRCEWGALYGNVALSLVLRLLGAKIGKRVWIRLPDHSPLCCFDLIEFGNDVSINYAYVSPISYTKDAMVCARVKLCNLTTILPRATVLGPVDITVKNTTVDVLTSIGTFGGGTIPNWKVKAAAPNTESSFPWISGSPVRYLYDMTKKQKHGMDEDFESRHQWKGSNLGVTLYTFFDFFLCFIERFLSSLLIVIPQILLLNFVAPTAFSSVTVYFIHFAVFFASSTTVAILKPVVLINLVRCFYPSNAGRYHLWSFQALMFHLKQKYFQAPQMVLNNTKLMNYWMSYCGVKVGNHVEFSQIKGLPDVITIGDDCFLANFTHIAVPHASRGSLTIGPVYIGKNSLIGNNACLPINSRLEESSILGVLSVPSREQNVEKDKIWIGNPPVSLPRGKDVEQPHLKAVWFVKRFIDDYLLTLTQTMWWCVLLFMNFGLLYFFSSTASVGSIFNLATLPTLGLQSTVPNWVVIFLASFFTRLFLGFTAALICMFAWSPVSKEKKYDSDYIFKWRHYNKTWSMFVRPMLVSPFEGSVWMNYIYRTCTRVRIGSWAFLASDVSFRDHNFVKIGANAVVCDETVFRTHTFEDWKLRFEKVVVGKGAVIRPSTTLMGGSVIGDNAIVEASTLVMKNEFISPLTLVGGIPAETICKLNDTKVHQFDIIRGRAESIDKLQKAILEEKKESGRRVMESERKISVKKAEIQNPLDARGNDLELALELPYMKKK